MKSRTLALAVLVVASSVVVVAPVAAAPVDAKVGTAASLDALRAQAPAVTDQHRTETQTVATLAPRVEDIQGGSDPIGDSYWRVGDIAAYGMTTSVDHVTALVVAVDMYESPFSWSWEIGQTV